MIFKVIVFPGSNCDDDMVHVLSNIMNQNVEKIWHKDRYISHLGPKDCIVLPGGFSYGDYLRSGAIARFAPIMESVINFAKNGGLVFGICNGFQVLCESGLLPGVLLRNMHQKFICKNVYIKKHHHRLINHAIDPNQVLKIPVAHADGRYFAKEDTLKSLRDNEQIIFKYCDERGAVNEESNINGSSDHIAGVCNKSGNVFGMMPHPERAAESILGNDDGRKIFESLVTEVLEVAS